MRICDTRLHCVNALAQVWPGIRYRILEQITWILELKKPLITFNGFSLKLNRFLGERETKQRAKNNVPHSNSSFKFLVYHFMQHDANCASNQRKQFNIRLRWPIHFAFGVECIFVFVYLVEIRCVSLMSVAVCALCGTQKLGYFHLRHFTFSIFYHRRTTCGLRV